jgi:chemotaxis protein methyltransferase CheR
MQPGVQGFFVILKLKPHLLYLPGMKHIDRQSQPPGSSLRLHPLDFEILREIIHEKSGIFFHDNKRHVAESRLLSRLNALRIPCFEDYITFVTQAGNYSELLRLIDCVTLTPSRFFDSKELFDCIEKQVLPTLIRQKKAANKKHIKIWSAACATGEEIFSIAMAHKASQFAEDLDVSIEFIGSDINTTALYQAECGLYNARSVTQVPLPYLDAFFIKTPEGYKVSESILEMVTFKRINLADRTDMMRLHEVDLVLCANVIYLFSSSYKYNLLQALYNCMSDEAYLVLGANETLFGLSHPFLEINTGNVKVYQKSV